MMNFDHKSLLRDLKNSISYLTSFEYNSLILFHAYHMYEYIMKTVNFMANMIFTKNNNTKSLVGSSLFYNSFLNSSFPSSEN